MTMWNTASAFNEKGRTLIDSPKYATFKTDLVVGLFDRPEPDWNCDWKALIANFVYHRPPPSSGGGNLPSYDFGPDQRSWERYFGRGKPGC
jgi:hypothetical protein